MPLVTNTLRVCLVKTMTPQEVNGRQIRDKALVNKKNRLCFQDAQRKYITNDFYWY